MLLRQGHIPSPHSDKRQRIRCVAGHHAQVLSLRHRAPRTHGDRRCRCQASGTDTSTKTVEREHMIREEETPEQSAPRSPFNTGSMDITTAGGTKSLCGHSLVAEKTVVVVRHGMTTWNEQQRIQGSSDGSELSLHGQAQAVRCRDALSRMQIDSCFSSPIRRARTTAEIMWKDQQGQCTYLDSLKEAHLGYLEGMKQADAATNHKEQFTTWRQRPSELNFDGKYPVLEVFDKAAEAWKDILEAPGSTHLIITHKSMMRAFLCTALGLSPTSFRAIDIHNGGISIFRINKKGEPMLTNMNMTAHMHHDGIFY